MSTDSRPALVEALTEQTRHQKIVVPGIYTLERLAWETRRRAQERIARKLAHGLSEDQLRRIDYLLVTAPDATRSELVWLRQPRRHCMKTGKVYVKKVPEYPGHHSLFALPVL